MFNFYSKIGPIVVRDIDGNFTTPDGLNREIIRQCREVTRDCGGQAALDLNALGVWVNSLTLEQEENEDYSQILNDEANRAMDLLHDATMGMMYSTLEESQFTIYQLPCEPPDYDNVNHFIVTLGTTTRLGSRCTLKYHDDRCRKHVKFFSNVTAAVIEAHQRALDVGNICLFSASVERATFKVFVTDDDDNWSLVKFGDDVDDIFEDLALDGAAI